MPAVVGSLPQTRGPHMPGLYNATKNKKPLTSNEISGFWHQLIILLWLQEISLKNEAVAVEVNPYEAVL